MVNSILSRVLKLEKETFGMAFKIENDIESKNLFRNQKGNGIGILIPNPSIVPYTNNTLISLCGISIFENLYDIENIFELNLSTS